MEKGSRYRATPSLIWLGDEDLNLDSRSQSRELLMQSEYAQVTVSK